MFSYQVNTTQLKAMQAAQAQRSLPLRAMPCGTKMQAIKNAQSMEMQTIRCGSINKLGSTELCEVCFAAFRETSILRNLQT